MADKQKDTAEESAIAGLIRAGLELGVAEASRKVTEHAPKVGRSIRDATGTGLVWSGAMAREMGKMLREDPDSVAHIVKEVWSRGGPKEKRIAAEALGKSLGREIPYKAITAARDLARMARTRKEAEIVGQYVFDPIIEKNPALVERVKTFLQENEEFVQRAALAGLVSLASRRKKYVGVVLQGLLLVAEAKEPETRRAVRAAVRKLAEVDAPTVAKQVTQWAKSDPNRQRVSLAKDAVKAAPAKAKQQVEKIVFAGLDKVANGSAKNGSSKAKSKAKPKGAKRGGS